jgi:hypothetical protein
VGVRQIEVSLAFADVELSAPSGTWGVLVVTPIEHVRVGRERLAVLRARDELGPLDASMVVEAQARQGRASIVVFRGHDDAGHGSWAFGDDLDESGRAEAATLMLRSHLVLYRALRDADYQLVLHTELGGAEVTAMRAAVDLHSSWLRSRPVFDDEERARIDADLWILRHLVFHFEIAFARLVESVLPEKIAMLERRATLRAAR